METSITPRKKIRFLIRVKEDFKADPNIYDMERMSLEKICIKLSFFFFLFF